MSNKKLILTGVLLFAIIIGLTAFFLNKQKKASPPAVPAVVEKKVDPVKNASMDKILIQASEGIQKISVSTGKTEAVSGIEQEDFSGFAGFPKLGIIDSKDFSQEIVLTSQDKSKALVTVVAYDSPAATSTTQVDSQKMLSADDYLCDIAQKKCESSKILSDEYQGAGFFSETDKVFMWWSGWDSAKNILYGNLTSEKTGNASPVYACDTQTKKCSETLGYDSMKKGDVSAVVPGGALSPSLQKLVMIVQNDTPNEVTGKKWELLQYATVDLSKPAMRMDISQAISTNENVAYDSVLSVSWTKDEKKIVMATSQKIFMLDLETKKMQLIYDAPFDEEGLTSFDGNGVVLSPDDKFVVFTDGEDVIKDENDENSDVDVINVLKKIDLIQNSEVTELMRGSDLSLKL